MSVRDSEESHSYSLHTTSIHSNGTSHTSTWKGSLAAGRASGRTSNYSEGKWQYEHLKVNFIKLSKIYIT